MASSPEQEIPQEIVKTATRHFAWWLAHPDHDDEDWVSAMRPALAAVLPDLQRPLLEEIEQLKKLLDEWKQICRYVDYWLRDAGIDRDSCGLAEGVKILAEQRDARPDLTDDEKRVVIEALDPTQWKPPYDGVAQSARAKLERSLDAHKP